MSCSCCRRSSSAWPSRSVTLLAPRERADGLVEAVEVEGAAPDATVNALAAENAFAAPACSVPALTVAPEYVPAPDSVNVPAPILVRPPVPAMVPEKIVLVLSPFVVSVAEPSVTLPAPASEPMVWFKLARSRVAPDATVNALTAENAFAAPACSVPA